MSRTELPSSLKALQETVNQQGSVQQNRDALQEQTTRWEILLSKPLHPTVLYLPQILWEWPSFLRDNPQAARCIRHR